MEEVKRTTEIISKLRKNCPSDIARTKVQLISCLEEEIGEVKEAILKEDRENLKEELGDFLFNVLFLIDIIKDEEGFTIENISKKLNNKMVFRHPHVFEDPREVKKEEADKIWKERKQMEKEQNIVH